MRFLGFNPQLWRLYCKEPIHPEKINSHKKKKRNNDNRNKQKREAIATIRQLVKEIERIGEKGELSTLGNGAGLRGLEL